MDPWTLLAAYRQDEKFSAQPTTDETQDKRHREGTWTSIGVTTTLA